MSEYTILYYASLYLQSEIYRVGSQIIKGNNKLVEGLSRDESNHVKDVIEALERKEMTLKEQLSEISAKMFDIEFDKA